MCVCVCVCMCVRTVIELTEHKKKKKIWVIITSNGQVTDTNTMFNNY